MNKEDEVMKRLDEVNDKLLEIDTLVKIIYNNIVSGLGPSARRREKELASE